MTTATRTLTARRTSLWSATGSVPHPGPLLEDLQVDVCVIGAGVAGLTTAYLLSRYGKSVAVLDDGPIAGGNTCRTTAHLTAVLDTRYHELERLHGTEGMQAAARSHTEAVDRIRGIIRLEDIHCDFQRVDGYLFAAADGPRDAMDREFDAVLRAGIPGVVRVPKAPLGDFETGPALRFPRQAQFHPLKYAAGLARAITRAGGRIFTETHATRVEGGLPARVYTGAGPVVTCEAVVVATNTPVDDLFVIHTKQAAYLSYVIGALVPRGSVPRGLYWDTEDPGHYVRLQQLSPTHIWEGEGPCAHEVLMVGGEDHRTGQADDQSQRYARLETWARERFPMIESVAFRWSGQVMNSVDGLGFIGRNPLDADNVYVATGDSGNGMTHGTIAGIMLTDMIRGIEHPWEGLYHPARRRLKASKTFARENLNALSQYGSWFGEGDVESAEELPPDSGAVIRRGLAKVAVYRDRSGNLHQRSAVCPHLGCVVAWNQAERSWDCPCHGSRFNCVGKVINGPANRDLARVTEIEAPIPTPVAVPENTETPEREPASRPGELAPLPG
jgi:glycine/D-amino acid oxidase-like deaminating enzyme/nitrite reductase/ring-hydroxylating ferredoxin subunit